MPLTSVQHYVQGLINGLVIGNGLPNLEAYITPPTVDTVDSPKAYVWGARLRGQRQAGPRVAGYKRLGWIVDIYLGYLTNPDSATVDDEFPQIIDAVLAAMWTTTIPTWISSAGVPIVVNPGQQPPAGASQILGIGEEFELEYPPERTPATLRMLYYAARIGMDVLEVIQA